MLISTSNSVSRRRRRRPAKPRPFSSAIPVQRGDALAHAHAALHRG